MTALITSMKAVVNTAWNLAEITQLGGPMPINLGMAAERIGRLFNNIPFVTSSAEQAVHTFVAFKNNPLWMLLSLSQDPFQ